jgi:hypothetical protein
MKAPHLLIVLTGLLSIAFPGAAAQLKTFAVPVLLESQFEQNRGQFEEKVLFLTRHPKHRMLLMERSLLFDLGRGGVVRIELDNCLGSIGETGETCLSGIASHTREPNQTRGSICATGNRRLCVAGSGDVILPNGMDGRHSC